jgi:hypothetical protein
LSIAAFTLSAAGKAHAWDVSTAINVGLATNGTIGTCSFAAVASGPTDSAFIGSGLGTAQTYIAGTNMRLVGFDWTQPSLTTSLLEANCGVTSATISSSIGVDVGEAFTDETLIEFVAQATETADGKTYDYVMRISGAAGAVAVLTSTRTEVVAANAAPTADAGTDQGNVDSGATVTLDGTGSSDSDGSIASYAWSETTSVGVTLSDATAAMPTFTAPIVNPGDLDVTITFELVVTDDGGASSVADSVSIVTGPQHASVAETQAQVATSAQTQATNIMGTAPSLGGFLSGSGGVASRNYNLSATNGNFNLNFQGSLLGASSKNFAGKYDLWAKVLAVHSDSGTSSSDFFIGYGKPQVCN